MLLLAAGGVYDEESQRQLLITITCRVTNSHMYR
jgi:hypothetical protein